MSKTTIHEYMTDGHSAVQRVSEVLEKAKASREYNMFINLTEQRALERARLVDEGKLTGRLAGVPFALKDNFMAFGAPTTAASHMLEAFTSPVQAEAVERLEAEGAICIGKVNLDAFAHGGSTENSAFGPTKNAVDTSRVAGGSSGGSAVAVALDIVPFTLGSDTGGSIRQPASFNGVYGIKPTYGAVSRYGVVAMASSTDTVGCFAHTPADVDLVMSVIAGQDDKDMTTLADYWQPTLPESKPLKIGLIRETLGEGTDEEVAAVTREYAQKLEEAGHTVEEVSLKMLAYTPGMYYIIIPAEVSSNLARYDGIRYGNRAEATNLEDVYRYSRDQGFEAENKRRIMMGSYVLSSGYFDAYYMKAQKARALLIQEFNALFQQYDVLVSPVAPTPAFKLGAKTHDPVQMYQADLMTIPVSLAGLPGVSVPAGASKDGLPIGVQLIGPMQSDQQLLGLAQAIEGKR